MASTRYLSNSLNILTIEMQIKPNNLYKDSLLGALSPRPTAEFSLYENHTLQIYKSLAWDSAHNKNVASLINGNSIRIGAAQGCLIAAQIFHKSGKSSARQKSNRYESYGKITNIFFHNERNAP